MNKDEIPAALCILHLEDSEPDHLLVQRELQKTLAPVVVRRVDTLEGFEHALQQGQFDLVLADYRLAGFTAMDAWSRLQAQAVQIPFILLSGAIGESAAAAAIKAGMSDYLPKSDLHKLAHVVQRSIEAHRLWQAKQRADAELAESERRLARLAEHLQSTIEQERAAIAREIHDDIGGSLTAIRFDLAWIQRHSSDAALLQHAQAATDMLQHAVDASQRIMLNLRPAILDQGLAPALRWLANGFSNRTRLATRVRAPQQLSDMPKNVQLVAYRTAQEALTNIAKHACNCTEVKIDLSDDNCFLTLEVSDNGPGLSEADLAKPTSFGIRGLKERARMIGGWIDISTRPGHGLAVTLSVPLDDTHPSPQDPHSS